MYKNLKKWLKFTIIRWKFQEYLFKIKTDEDVEFRLGDRVPLENGSVIEYVGRDYFRFYTIKTRAEA
mgnify:CR=1 FL=1